MNVKSRQKYRRTEHWKNRVKQVHERDKVCRLCGCNHDLQVHHYDKSEPYDADNINNLVLLCKECHFFLHHNIPDNVRESIDKKIKGEVSEKVEPEVVEKPKKLTKKDAKSYVKSLHIERFIKNPAALAGEIDAVLLEVTKKIFANLDNFDNDQIIKVLDTLQKTSHAMKKIDLEKQQLAFDMKKLEAYELYQKNRKFEENHDTYAVPPICIASEDSNV